MNVLNAIGNISKDAEVRHTPNGDVVCQFNFALNSGYGDKQIATWLNCSIWGKRAETLAPMLLKGTKIGITGELTNRPYTAKDGTEKHSLEVRVSDVTLLGKPAAGNNIPEDRPERNQANPAGSTSSPAKGSGFDDFEDDIPF